MEGNFNKAFNILILLEGFESNLSKDIGGATVYGITSKFWPKEFKIIKSLVKAGKLDEAKLFARNFYFHNFWDKFKCQRFPDKIDILYFCTAVNTPKGLKFISIKTDDFTTECLDAIDYYINHANSTYKTGLVNRVLKIWKGSI